MKGFILAAGFGERLRPLTDITPKPLVPVASVPSICYSIAFMKMAGIRDVICNLCYKSDAIIDFFKKNNNFGMNIIFSVEEGILGTGGGLKKCESFLKDDSFILINSDIITDLEPGKLLNSFNRLNYAGILSLYGGKQREMRKTVSVEGDRISDINNLMKTGAASQYDYMGIAVLTPVIFDYLQSGFSCLVKTGYSGLLENHSMGYHIHEGIWSDIGTVDKLEKANKLLEERGKYFPEKVRDTLGFSV